MTPIQVIIIFDQLAATILELASEAGPPASFTLAHLAGSLKELLDSS